MNKKTKSTDEVESTEDELNTNSSDPETFTKTRKLQMSSELKEKLMDIPGALEYIQRLEKVIEKQIKKIAKWKSKVKKTQKFKDAFTQTKDCNEPAEKCMTNFQTGLDVEETKNSIEGKEPKNLADDIKEAAEMATQNSGFVYEETSGMYYDYNTGYYYNAEYGLYYDGNSGTYLKYNQETQNYEFHSQVTTETATHSTVVLQEHKPKVKSKRKKQYGSKAKDWKRKRQEAELPKTDLEEGELSQSSDSSESYEENSDSSDISKQWPPCMRIIIETCENPKIKIGSLHIITCDGGSIGREGKHSVLLPDINVSKHHLKISFDKETNKYMAVDLGSRNGTSLNGKRMSPSKQESEPMEVTHGSKIQIGSTVLLCHIHDGTQTCGHCEPGLIQTEAVPEKIEKLSMADKHKNELKKLKKQCGFIGYSDDSNAKLPSGYTDRAQKRREIVGSQNPHEKTKMASLDESISSENKGFKLLSKMGWKEGQSLGKAGEGMLEPVKPIVNPGTAGIGAQGVLENLPVNENKQNIWIKTQERFKKLPAFQDEESD